MKYLTDTVIILVILLLCAFAARSLIKRRGSCGCGCAGCKKGACGEKPKRRR